MKIPESKSGRPAKGANYYSKSIFTILRTTFVTETLSGKNLHPSI